MSAVTMSRMMNDARAFCLAAASASLSPQEGISSLSLCTTSMRCCRMLTNGVVAAIASCCAQVDTRHAHLNIISSNHRPCFLSKFGRGHAARGVPWSSAARLRCVGRPGTSPMWLSTLVALACHFRARGPRLACENLGARAARARRKHAR